IILSTIISLIISRVMTSIYGEAIEKEREEEVVIIEDKKLDHAAQTLSILQKKGRLIDFLLEDISPFDDGQVGAAVRNIHRDCKEALLEHFKIEPIIDKPEGSTVEIDKTFDPSLIRLTGNVVGNPPFKGVLRHCGWRLTSVSLPSLPETHDATVIEPAEVEIE
ncbi:MAG: DUF2760 domain-containing protein, partial [Nitrospirae bacterium]